MTLQPGDWIRAETGEVGKVVHVTRLSVFVQIEGDSKESTLKAFLQSQLTRIDPPRPTAGPASRCPQ
jgi:hypothetical protein